MNSPSAEGIKVSRNEPEDRENFLVDLQTRFSTELSIWEFQGIKVYYTPKLDGGGRSFGPFGC